MAPEDAQESLCLVISMAFCIDFTVTVAEVGQHIHRPIADIFKLLQAFLHGVSLQIRKQSFKDLNAGAFVEEKEVPRWIHEQIHQMLHLGKEVRVSDVKKIAALVWFEMVCPQYAVNR